MLPASDMVRPAPAWLRYPVFAGVGLLLLVPLIQISFRNLVHNPTRLAREITERFLNAAVEGNLAELQALAPPKLGMIAGTAAFTSSKYSIPSDAVGTPAIQGQNGNVPFVLTQQDGTRLKGMLQLTWDEQTRRWHVRSVDFPLQDQPKGQSNPNPGDQPRSPKPVDFGDLRPVDPAVFEKSWRTNLDVKNEPAGPLLRRLLTEAGLPETVNPNFGGTRPQRPDPPSGSWERKPITLTMRQRSRLEIIETVARMAGLELHQIETSSLFNPFMTLPMMGPNGPFRIESRDPQYAPVIAFVGPFRVEVTSFTESGRYATGHLQMNALAGNLPDSMVQILDGWQPTIPDPVVRGVDGRDLYHKDRRERFTLPVVHVDRQTRMCVVEWHVPLRNLTLDVTRIGSIKGSLSTLMPVKMDTGKIMLQGNQGNMRIGPAELKWRRHVGVPPAGTYTFNPMLGQQGMPNPTSVGLLVSYEQSVPCRVCWMSTDARGTRMQTGTLKSSTEQYLPQSDSWAALEVKVFTTEEVRYPFELRDVPNPNRPPARLAPLTFSGRSEPLSFPKKTLVKQSLTLEVRNHTNKPVEEVLLEVRYLDATGAERGKNDVVHPVRIKTPYAPFQVVGPPNAFLDGDTAVAIHLAVNPPDGTARVEVALKRVLFADATTWSPER
jgi:hypothetical protein